MKVKTLSSAIALALGLVISGVATAESAPSPEEMWKIIQQQQQTIEALKSKLDNTEQKVVATEEKVAANTEAVEEVEESSGSFLGGNTTLGGYGELHYNNLDNTDNDQVDFHRFVLFFGHEFNDKWRFFSELELEHSLSGDGEPGEVELEQAYVEYDINETNHLKAGLYLVPVGLINETHEPPTFYGVERNNVEKNIIPATWWEAGIGLSGEIAPGVQYDVMLHSGLATSAGSSYNIRSGRQKVAEAIADNGAVTGRIRYTGFPGLVVGLSAQYQDDLTQGEDISANLVEAHVDYNRNGFGLRALYASWWLDDGPALTGPAAIGADRQKGFYVEPSYRFNTPIGDTGVFVRYQEWNNRAGSDADDNEQIDIGVNYWPHENIVFKFDYQFENETAGDNDGFNLGVGYQF